MTPTDTPPPRDKMAGKPVFSYRAKTIINMKSGFEKKLLCDGPTFSTGAACVYGCTFCYVPDIMAKAAYLPKDLPHEECVIRREAPLEIMFEQLTTKNKKGTIPARRPKYDINDDRVIFASPLVDVAPNIELLTETAEACIMILKLTGWRIRLLSKSNMLPLLAKKIADGYDMQDAKRRMLFGVSTGTLDDRLAAAFEVGCPIVKKRIESLHKLQDTGWKTYGMVCPSLPQRDYKAFSESMAHALRSLQMPDVWAEVINVRGESMVRTCAALRKAGYGWEASNLELVAQDKDAWEEYSRATFEAHAAAFPTRLRFLQYVTKANREYWTSKTSEGAVLL